MCTSAHLYTMNIHIHLFYIQIPILTVAFSVISRFLTLCFNFREKIVGSVKDIAWKLKIIFYG